MSDFYHDADDYDIPYPELRRLRNELAQVRETLKRVQEERDTLESERDQARRVNEIYGETILTVEKERDRAERLLEMAKNCCYTTVQKMRKERDIAIEQVNDLLDVLSKRIV